MGCGSGFGNGAGSNFPSWSACLPFDFTLFNGFAALLGDIQILSIPARTVIEGVVIKTKTQWVGVGLTSLTFSVGIVGTLDKYLGLYDGLAAPSNTNFGTSETLQVENFGAAVSVRLGLVSTGANLSVLTAGTGCLYLKTSQLGIP